MTEIEKACEEIESLRRTGHSFESAVSDAWKAGMSRVKCIGAISTIRKVSLSEAYEIFKEIIPEVLEAAPSKLREPNYDCERKRLTATEVTAFTDHADADDLSSVQFGTDGYEEYFSICRSGESFYNNTSETDGGLDEIYSEYSNQVKSCHGSILFCELKNEGFEIEFDPSVEPWLGFYKLSIDFKFGKENNILLHRSLVSIFRGTSRFRSFLQAESNDNKSG